MWVELPISEKKFYLLCTTNDKDEVDCVLYDGQESWHERQPVSIILKRAKELNKRIQFDEATIKETLYKAQPTETNWLNGDGDTNECSLKLKYRVQSCPLNFTWFFSKQTEHDGFAEQNEELREIVRKKDLEIKQYKTEGAILKRVTVATQPFCFISFDKKHAESIALSKSIMQISDLLKAQYKPMQTPVKTISDNEDDQPKDSDVKLTPRRKRRKILEEQQRIIAEKLKAHGKPMEYESSQSQHSSNSPEVLDVEKLKKENTSLEKKSEVDVPILVKKPIEETPPSTPSKCLRARKEPIRSKTEESPSPKKRKPTGFIEYDDSESSSEEEKEKRATPSKADAKKSNELKTDAYSQLNTTLEHNSDDIQSIIDDWKALEQRRVADLSNTRTTRTGKRISS